MHVALAGEAGGELVLHLVEVERACRARRPRRARRPGRARGGTKIFGLDAGDGDVRGGRDADRQHALGLEEDVGVEAGAFVAGADDVDDAVEGDLAAARDIGS